jgi:hypothetical protein
MKHRSVLLLLCVTAFMVFQAVQAETKGAFYESAENRVRSDKSAAGRVERSLDSERKPSTLEGDRSREGKQTFLDSTTGTQVEIRLTERVATLGKRVEQTLKKVETRQHWDNEPIEGKVAVYLGLPDDPRKFSEVFNETLAAADETKVMNLRRRVESLNSDKIITRSADHFTRSEIEWRIKEAKELGSHLLVIVAHSITESVPAKGDSESVRTIPLARDVESPSRNQAISFPEFGDLCQQFGIEGLIISCRSPDLDLSKDISWEVGVKILERAVRMARQSSGESFSTREFTAALQKAAQEETKGFAEKCGKTLEVLLADTGTWQVKVISCELRRTSYDGGGDMEWLKFVVGFLLSTPACAWIIAGRDASENSGPQGKEAGVSDEQLLNNPWIPREHLLLLVIGVSLLLSAFFADKCPVLLVYFGGGAGILVGYGLARWSFAGPLFTRSNLSAERITVLALGLRGF